jgi:hypothetical protein
VTSADTVSATIISAGMLCRPNSTLSLANGSLGELSPQAKMTSKAGKRTQTLNKDNGFISLMNLMLLGRNDRRNDFPSFRDHDGTAFLDLSRGAVIDKNDFA